MATKKESKLRFIKEYANFRKQTIIRCYIKDEQRDKAIFVIDRAVCLVYRGMISVTECMRVLTDTQEYLYMGE